MDFIYPIILCTESCHNKVNARAVPLKRESPAVPRPLLHNLPVPQEDGWRAGCDVGGRGRGRRGRVGVRVRGEDRCETQLGLREGHVQRDEERLLVVKSEIGPAGYRGRENGGKHKYMKMM